jgi:hypothetical protein
VAQADRRFASRFVGLLLQTARQDSRFTDSVNGLGAPPIELECSLEPKVHGRSREGLGYVDLRFDGEDFTLFVENKLGSAFGDKQLKRYHTALQHLPAAHRRRGLVAVTREVPGDRELDVRGEGWLGAVRWAKLYDAALSELEIGNEDLAAQWRAFMKIMHDDGELGVASADSNLILAWTRHDDAKRHLRDILDNLREPALEALRDGLKAKRWAGPKARLAGQHYYDKSQNQAFTTRSSGSVTTAFRIPSNAATPNLQLYFWAAAARRPVFVVDVAPRNAAKRLASGDKQLRGAVDKLLDRGFTESKDGASWWFGHEPDEYLHDADVPGRLLELLETDIKLIVDCAVFNGDLTGARKSPSKVSRFRR